MISEERIKELAVLFAVKIVAEKQQPIPYRGSIEELIRTVAAEAEQGWKDQIKAADSILETYIPDNDGPLLHDRVFRVVQELEQQAVEAWEEGIEEANQVWANVCKHASGDTLQTVIDEGVAAAERLKEEG